MAGPYKLDLLYQAHLGHTVHIYVTSFTLDEHDRVLLSPECRTIGELEYAANRLRGDLDRLVAEARKRFNEPAPPLYPGSDD